MLAPAKLFFAHGRPLPKVLHAFGVLQLVVVTKQLASTPMVHPVKYLKFTADGLQMSYTFKVVYCSSEHQKGYHSLTWFLASARSTVLQALAQIFECT